MRRTLCVLMTVCLLTTAIQPAALAQRPLVLSNQNQDRDEYTIGESILILLAAWAVYAVYQRAVLSMDDRRAERRVNEYLSIHPNADARTLRAIREESIFLGMDAEAARIALGKPTRVNRSVGSWGVHEQWVYGTRLYVYIRNGVVSSWQD